MKKILIIGCGYAGIVAAWRLHKLSKKVEVTVIDRKISFNFSPLLPDTIGRDIPPAALAYPIQRLALIYKFNFINEEVKSLDLEQRRVFTPERALGYDYLIIASGSKTNFYGNEAIEKYAYKLDDVQDAERIKEALKKGGFDSYIISGGGYTGAEIAANLRTYLNRNAKRNRIIIVERAPSILGPLPEWMKGCVRDNLRRLNIEVFTSAVIENIEEGSVYLSNGGSLNNCMLIWSAGVKTADFLQDLNVTKNPQGRLRVDEYLRINDSCYACGDTSYFSYNNTFLRMAVQFAVAQGSCAVSNIINSVTGSKLRKYKPMDLGYIIPLANNNSCGNILKVDMKGMPATMLHYFMSVYRSYGLKNKLRIIKALIKFGGL